MALVDFRRTVATIFTFDPHEARQEARLLISDYRLRHEPVPTFLGPGQVRQNPAGNTS